MMMTSMITRLALIVLCMPGLQARAQETPEQTAIRAELMRPAGVTNDWQYWRKRGDQARQLGDQALRRKVLEEGLGLVKDKGLELYLMREYWSTLRALGNPVEYIPYGEKLILHDPRDYAQRFVLAINYLALGNLERAQTLIKEAQAFGDNSAGFKDAEANALGQLAQRKGQLEDAIKHLQQSVSFADQAAAEQPLNVPKAGNRTYRRMTLASAMSAAGQYTQALEALRTARELAIRSALSGNVLADIERRFGFVYLDQGSYDKALITLERAWALAQAAGQTENSENFASVLAKRLTALIGLKRLDEARKVASEEIPRAQNLQKASAIILSIATWLTNDAEQAQQFADKALNESQSLYGDSHPSTLFAEALRNSITASTSPTPAKLAQLGQSIERLRADKATPNGASQALRQYLFDRYLSLQTQQANRTPQSQDDAFLIAEERRASGVGTVVAEAARRAVSRQAGLAELVKRKTEVAHELSAAFDNLAAATSADKAIRDDVVITRLRAQLRNLQDEQLQIERSISVRYPQYNELTSTTPVTPADAARLLARDEVLVSLLPAETTTYVWIITRDRAPLAYTVPLGEAALREQVVRLRRTLDIGLFSSNRIPAFDTLGARTLYDALLGPAQALLAGRAQLIVNASGPLAQIPFGVLVTGPDGPHGTSWLAREHSISHIASIGAFSALRQSSFHTAAARPFIGFGDPQFSRMPAKSPPLAMATRNLALPRSADTSDNERLAAALKQYDQIPPLPETREELLAIADALGADKNADVFLGRAASREAVLKANLADYQVLSFSTHGLMAGDLPGLTQPALAMAAPEKEGESPLLLLEDVMSLKLNADWVVLSACNTAAADGQSGEALSGLARGFFYAGARSLLVTHWAVESVSAQQLMTETFKAYAANKSLSRAEALRTAQIKLMKNPKYAHPFYWAPYALVGDGS